MLAFETRTTRVSFFGRFADELTRRSISADSFRAVIADEGREPFYKEDGSCAFVDLEPKATPYTVSVTSNVYRHREISATLPTLDPVGLGPLAGEDELYVSVTTVDGGLNQVSFTQVPFLPTIVEDAEVIGSGGFTATLQEPLEGENVDFAVLDTVAGLTGGETLRIVRSDRLLLRPGPYYRFPGAESVTVLSACISESTPSAEPIAGAQVRVTRVNSVAILTESVDGLLLNRVQFGPGDVGILGPTAAVRTRTNSRGEALLDYPAHHPIATLRIEVTHPNYVPLIQDVAVPAGEVTRWTPSLTPV